MFVKVQALSSKTTVPVASGKVIVLSADTVPAFNNISLLSALLPSNCTPLEVDTVSTLFVVVVPVTVKLPGIVIVSEPSPIVAAPPKLAFNASFTFAVSVTSAEASIPLNLLFSASVNALVSELFS